LIRAIERVNVGVSSAFRWCGANVVGITKRISVKGMKFNTALNNCSEYKRICVNLNVFLTYRETM